VSGAWALARLELRRSFRTPVGLAVIGLYLLVHGFYLVSLLEAYSDASQQAIALGQSTSRLNLVDQVLQPLASADTFLLLLLLPGLTMRLLAEEWRSGTSELLLSYPLREWDVVLGKFLGAAGLLGILLILGLIHPLVVGFFGGLEVPTLLSQQLGLILFGLLCLAVGLAYSAATESQLLAFGATVITLFVTWFFAWWGRSLEGATAAAVSWLSPATHFSPLSLGLLRLSDLIYFAAVTAFCLYLAVGTLEGRRAGGRS
jgi:ABC-2 type transport system permease protein